MYLARLVKLIIRSRRRLPVSVLDNNIIDEFEKILQRNNRELAGPVKAGLVHREIEILLDDTPPKGPYANLETRRMCIYESHLAFLWSYVYSSFVIFEEGVQKPIIDGTSRGEIAIDGELLVRAALLHEWAIKFSSQYQEWDTDRLPNPKRLANIEEKSYVGKANSIFLRAVMFLLLHEYAHLVLEHEKTGDDPWELDQEKDADNFAMSFLVDQATSEQDRMVAGVSIVLLFASTCFLPRDIGGIWQQTHPHLHDRLRNGIAGLNLETEESKSYLYFLASLSLKRYLESQGYRCEQVESETAETLFYEYLEKIDVLLENRV